MHSWIKEFCVTMFWGNSHYNGVITKQSFPICPKFEGSGITKLELWQFKVIIEATVPTFVI